MCSRNGQPRWQPLDCPRHCTRRRMDLMLASWLGSAVHWACPELALPPPQHWVGTAVADSNADRTSASHALGPEPRLHSPPRQPNWRSVRAS